MPEFATLTFHPRPNRKQKGQEIVSWPTAFSILLQTQCWITSGNFLKNLPRCTIPAMLTAESKTL
jgi:hypothetical protein